jgi:KUP system potassium uptake protein
VVLAITGGESPTSIWTLRPSPIRIVWFTVVMPAPAELLRRGALLINEPGSAENPFFLLAPRWALYPLVGLATCATVIASQAVISGAFSITMQAVQFGFLPRLTINHTSSREFGQIYIPSINWALMVACILRCSASNCRSNSAAAYGIAVISTMTIMSIMFFACGAPEVGLNSWLAFSSASSLPSTSHSSALTS